MPLKNRIFIACSASVASIVSSWISQALGVFPASLVEILFLGMVVGLLVFAALSGSGHRGLAHLWFVPLLLWSLSIVGLSFEGSGHYYRILPRIPSQFVSWCWIGFPVGLATLAYLDFHGFNRGGAIVRLSIWLILLLPSMFLGRLAPDVGGSAILSPLVMWGVSFPLLFVPFGLAWDAMSSLRRVQAGSPLA